MPLFALPFATSYIPTSIRSHLVTRNPNKRRRRSSSTQSSPTDSESASEIPQLSTSLAFEATNPLGLSPDEVEQYRTAGLELDNELPSKTINDFPHRGLPPSFPGGVSPVYDKNHDHGCDNDHSGVETSGVRYQEHEKRYGQRRSPHLRMQHLAVLAAILHRCLLEGDIPRATRAWAMLLRTQVNGSNIDIRTSSYWGIGAELLVRSNELPDERGGKHDDTDAESTVSRSGLEEEHDESENGPRMTRNWIEHEGRNRIVKQSWGSTAGLEKAKEYYERLILQHPYKRQFHNSVNPLDFWPAMVGCEIYGIQFNHKEALRRLDSRGNNSDDQPHVSAAGDGDAIPDDSDANETFSVDEHDEVAADPDTFFASQRRREAHRRIRKLELMWLRRDMARRTALAAAQAVAVRMDDLMMLPPYSDSYALLRLRGMLALYVGDLSVPSVSPEDDADGDDDRAAEEHGGPPLSNVGEGSTSERRLLAMQRRAEHERGLRKRREEMARARGLFERLKKKAGGGVDPQVARLSAALGVNEEDDDDLSSSSPSVSTFRHTYTGYYNP